MNKLNPVILLLALVACGSAEGRDLFKDGAAIQLGEEFTAKRVSHALLGTDHGLRNRW